MEFKSDREGCQSIGKSVARRKGEFQVRHSFTAIFAGVLSLAVGWAQEPVKPVLLPPVNDNAIRTNFEKKVTALMEEGETPEVDVLLAGLKTAKTKSKISVLPQSYPELSDAEFYRKARKATLVFGRVYQCDKCDRWHGSNAGAVIIDPSGIAVTNYHVMDHIDSGAFGAMNSDGEVFAVEEVLAASKKDDLAVVRLKKGADKTDFPFVPLSEGDPVGTEIRVVSHPDGRFYTLSEGIIARYFVDKKTKTNRVQITADYARGSSGSGVFNMRGELVGVVAATTSIYYSREKGRDENLQMVVKSCIPVVSVRALFE